MIRCPHCNEVKFKLGDVKAGDPIKIYTDTPKPDLQSETPQEAQGTENYEEDSFKSVSSLNHAEEEDGPILLRRLSADFHC